MEIWIWLGIIILLSIWEALTVGLVSIWFIISGIVSLILSFFKVDFTICFSVFVILGLILMITTRKSLTKLLKVKSEPTNLDRIIGKKGIVTETINGSLGEVKVDGKLWSAYSNKKIEKDSYVKVLEINSTKLKVKVWEE